MKNIKFSARKLALGAAVLAAISFARVASAVDVPQIIRVTSVIGECQYSLTPADPASWKPAKVGLELDKGAALRTAVGGIDFEIVDKDAIKHSGSKTTHGVNPGAMIKPPPRDNAAEERNVNSLHIFQHSILGVDKIILDRNGHDEVSDIQLDLQHGDVFGNVKKMSAASKYEIKLPGGVAGIRGTTFLLGDNGNITVLNGQVSIVVVNAQTGQISTKVITEGNVFNAATGQIIPLPINVGGTGPAGSPIVAPVVLVNNAVASGVSVTELTVVTQGIISTSGTGTTVTTPGNPVIIVVVSPNG